MSWYNLCPHYLFLFFISPSSWAPFLGFTSKSCRLVCHDSVCTYPSPFYLTSLPTTNIPLEGLFSLYPSISPLCLYPSISPLLTFCIISHIIALHRAAIGFKAMACCLANSLPSAAAFLKSSKAASSDTVLIRKK